MKILMLGGTGFLGPDTVRAALARGHEVTLFNRGKTNPTLFPDLEKLQGDRRNDLKSLEGRTWDAAVDTSGYFPKHVTMSAELLGKQNLKHYVFISSVSVYPESAFTRRGVDETEPVDTVKGPDPDPQKMSPENYGPLKALCEQAAEKAMPGRTTSIRPGLIVGPGDPTDRFTYWPARIDRAGEVLCPGDGTAAAQFIDARDLADFIITVIEDGHEGTFNALGSGLRTPADRANPWEPELSFREFLSTCKGVSGSPATLTWVDEPFLAAQGVGPWMEMPLWVPSDAMSGFARVSNKRAVDVGLKFRPVGETIRDTLAWHKADAERTAPDYKWGAGIAPENEAAVLKAWRERSKQHAPDRLR